MGLRGRVGLFGGTGGGVEKHTRRRAGGADLSGTAAAPRAGVAVLIYLVL
eukprot:COSAG02_NODE_28308_length_592_cov_0.618661_1_plen_49_part_01